MESDSDSDSTWVGPRGARLPPPTRADPLHPDRVQPRFVSQVGLCATPHLGLRPTLDTLTRTRFPNYAKNDMSTRLGGMLSYNVGPNSSYMHINLGAAHKVAYRGKFLIREIEANVNIKCKFATLTSSSILLECPHIASKDHLR